MIVSQLFAANVSSSSIKGSFMLRVPMLTVWVFVMPFREALTLQSPASGSSSVHVPSVPAVPVTVLEPFAAVTAAPALVVTISFGTMPVWIAWIAETKPAG